MKKFATSLAVLSLVITSAAFAGDKPKWTKTDVKSTPAEVQAAVKKLVGDGTIQHFRSRTEDDKTTYRIAFKAADHNQKADIDSAGKVLEQEISQTPAELPKEVTAAIKTAHATGEIGEAKKVTKNDTEITYEVRVKLSKDEHKMTLAPDGKVLEDAAVTEKGEEKEKAK